MVWMSLLQQIFDGIVEKSGGEQFVIQVPELRSDWLGSCSLCADKMTTLHLVFIVLLALVHLAASFPGMLITASDGQCPPGTCSMIFMGPEGMPISVCYDC
ncbi:hypothetical protein QR680_014454 [Steinernema hermaphroditum]|uniref:Uncharacterized protein n=1 Tax=Steinernema hermaphroditum TaxID=289476 RepID=A0AA39M375_9BILA|nr:hypothetical protein QR680_014454 [Steinernema hermaphroditum]